MPSSRREAGDLPGNVPDASATALMLVDVINELDFRGNEDLVKHAASLCKTIAALKARCRKAGIPAIYVSSRARNDQCRTLQSRPDG